MDPKTQQIYEFGAFRLDLTERLLTRKGKPITLTPKAFEVLVWLLERHGHLVEKDELMNAVWADSVVEEANLSRTVWALRNALGDDRNGHKYIQTIPKHGYRFIADVRIVENNSTLESNEGPTHFNREREAATAEEIVTNGISTAPKSALDFRENSRSSTGSYWRRSTLLVSGVVVVLLLATGLSLVFLSRRSGKPQTNESSVSDEAKNAYVRGVYSCAEARNGQTAEESKTRYLKGLESLRRAVEIEPTWVEGVSELANCGIWRAAGDASYYPMAKSAAVSALKLDELNVKAHLALGFALWRSDWDRVGAEKEYNRAVELDDNNDMGYPGYALFLSSDGRHEEAIRIMERAAQLDPSNYVNRHNLGYVYLRAKQYDRAIDKFKAAIEIFPKHYIAHVGLGQALACVGRSDEAIAVTRSAIENLTDPSRGTEDKMKALRLAWVYARVGQQDHARKILHEMESLPEPDSTSTNILHFAMVYAELGEKDNAFKWLRKAFDSHTQSLCWLKTSPEFEKLHGDPRFTEMLGRLGLRP